MPSSNNDEGVDGRRNFARLRVGVSARFNTLGGSQKVRLVDLSQAGAQIILSNGERPAAGLLTWLDYEAFGEAVWQDGDCLGIKFEGLLPLGCLVGTRKKAPSVVQAEALGEDLAQAWVSGELSDN